MASTTWRRTSSTWCWPVWRARLKGFRDARILTIYEGTTAIQANDFVGRKTVRDGGAVAHALCAQIAMTEQDLAAHTDEDCAVMRRALEAGRLALESAIVYVVANAKTDTKAVYAGAVNYLMLAGVVLCGWQMARAMMVALDKKETDLHFYGAKLATVRFYAEAILPQAGGLAAAIIGSGRTVTGVSADMF